MLSKQDAQKAVTNSLPNFHFSRRKNHLSSAKDFKAVFKGADRVDTPFFRLYIAPKTGTTPRYAFAATKKTGCAVVRNRCKRRFYEIIRKNQYHLSQDYDMIFFINRRSYDREYSAVESAVLTAIKQKNRQTL